MQMRAINNSNEYMKLPYTESDLSGSVLSALAGKGSLGSQTDVCQITFYLILLSGDGRD